MIKIFSRLVECTQHQHQKRGIHKQIIAYCNNYKINPELAQKVNTITSGIIFEKLSKEEINKWINILEDRSGRTHTPSEEIKII